MNSRHITYLFVVINEIEYAKLVKITFINKQVVAIYTQSTPYAIVFIPRHNEIFRLLLSFTRSALYHTFAMY